MADIYLSLVEALLPSDCPDSARSAFAASAARLVRKRIQGLALPMRLAVTVTGILFGGAAFLVLGKAFAEANIAERQNFIDRAEKVPLIPFRELIRLVRSFTLVTYYDDPQTRERMGFVPGGNRRMAA